MPLFSFPSSTTQFPPFPLEFSLIFLHFLVQFHQNLENPSGFLLFFPTMSSLILFLFCLLLHGSHARYLGLHGSSYDRNGYHFGEIAEEIEPMRSISSNTPSKFTPRALLGSFKTEKQVENGENNLIGVNPTKQKASNSSQKDSSLSGTKEVVMSDEIDLHGKEYKTKGGIMKIRRETKESRMHEEDEAVDLMVNGGEEDVVMMDYAQPQRKPPIHS